MARTKKSKPTGVIVFRIGADRAKELNDLLSNPPVVGVKSVNQLARKIVTDVIAGRAKLEYLDPADAGRDCELYAES